MMWIFDRFVQYGKVVKHRYGWRNNRTLIPTPRIVYTYTVLDNIEIINQKQYVGSEIYCCSNLSWKLAAWVYMMARLML